jgi:hypothetical protein
MSPEEHFSDCKTVPEMIDKFLATWATGSTIPQMFYVHKKILEEYKQILK